MAANAGCFAIRGGKISWFDLHDLDWLMFHYSDYPARKGVRQDLKGKSNLFGFVILLRVETTIFM